MKSPSRSELIKEIKRIRKVIRSHRDAKGDDRCWLDDYKVWAKIGVIDLTALPPLIEMMKLCDEFWTYRQAETADPLPVDAIIAKRFWNSDLVDMTTKQLTLELSRLVNAITKHRLIISRPRTVGDDRALYAVLPEKIPADFRLPPKDEFLGEAKAPHAGCPSFHGSHANCSSSGSGCNVHQWGPCRKTK